MKHSTSIVCAVSIFAAYAPCIAAAVQSEPVVTERGPHHRVWTRQTISTLPDGRFRTNSLSFVELGSGTHRWDAQASQWIDAEAVVEIENNTAIGRRTAHQATFTQNANTPGAVTLVTPDGKTLRSHVLGVAWFDSANGNSLLIGELKDSAGEVHPPNVVIYPNAFDGLEADLRYTHRLGGFEQDVIIRENPPLPQGFAPDTTRLEVWTEFIEAPASTLTQRARAAMVDDTLNFGAMQTGAGKAFALGQEANPGRSAPVAKRWLTIDGRTFLVESARYDTIKRELEKLPNLQAAVKAPNANGQVAAAKAREPNFGDRAFPPAPKPRATKPGEVFRTAAISSPSPFNGEKAGVRGETALANPQPRPGLVLDYTVITSISDLTLKCDTTYYVTNTAWLSGTVSIEGGTVVKFAKTNIAQIVFDDVTVRWLTDQYRPAIFTAKDDHTVGEVIGSATLSGYYGSGLRFTADPTETNLNARFSHLGTSISVDLSILRIRHAQFVHCERAMTAGGFNSTGLRLENVLLYDIGIVVDGDLGGTAYNVTAHQCDSFSEYERLFTFYNSLVLDSPGFGMAPGYNNSFDGSSSGVFQTVGAAAHYLANGSVHRNAGATSGLTATLIADLKKLTTYPPVVLNQIYVSLDTTLAPLAQRDTDLPDRGYHYAPLDYVVTGVWLTNCTLTLTGGVAVGIAPTNNLNYAIGAGYGANIASVGSPTALNRIVRHNTVQEQANSNWTNSSPSIVLGYWTPPQATARFKFTEFSGLAGAPSHLEMAISDSSAASLNDCLLHGSFVQTTQPGLAMTNCLLNRTELFIDDGYNFDLPVSLFQNTFFGGPVTLWQGTANSWLLTNNLFVTNALTAAGNLNAGYNGYVTNGLCAPIAGSVNNVLTNSQPVFQSGSLGYFYLPAGVSFIDTGSATNATNAALFGFYHYTTLTNQVAERTNRLDVGFHYIVVTNQSSVVTALDYDGDGLPDYFEDANGNGVADGSETDWKAYNSKYGIGAGPGLITFTLLK